MECHSSNIAVGGVNHAMCDTFSRGESSSETGENTASVTNCNVASCESNNSMSCNAPGIELDWHSDHADCETYLLML